MIVSSAQPNYEKIAKYCNLWRNYRDIQDSWSSVQNISNFFGEDLHDFMKYGAPGSFNDPDMVCQHLFMNY